MQMLPKRLYTRYYVFFFFIGTSVVLKYYIAPAAFTGVLNTDGKC